MKLLSFGGRSRREYKLSHGLLANPSRPTRFRYRSSTGQLDWTMSPSIVGALDVILYVVLLANMFADYQDLDPAICAELVLQAMKTHRAPQPAVAPQYGMPPPSGGGYGIPQQQQPQYGLPPVQSQQAGGLANNPQLTQLLGSLNGQDLQKLLSAAGVQQPQTPQTPHQPQQPAAGGITPDLARILATAGVNTNASGQAAAYGQPPVQSATPQQNSYNALASNPALASLLSGAAAQQPVQQVPVGGTAGGQPDMQEIMAQLAKYKR